MTVRVLLLLLLTLPSGNEAARLRGEGEVTVWNYGANVPVPQEMAVELRISRRGAIRSVAVTLPRVGLPTPWWFQFPDLTEVGGVAGRIYDRYVNDTLVADARLKFTRLSAERAREWQWERKIYSYDGAEEVFRPEDGSASSVVSQDLTPHISDESASATRWVPVERTVAKSGHLVIRLGPRAWSNVPYNSWPLELLTVHQVRVELSPRNRNRWTALVVVARGVGHSDTMTQANYSATVRLRGRAIFDRAAFKREE